MMMNETKQSECEAGVDDKILKYNGFHEVMEMSTENNKLVHMIYDNLYRKRLELIGSVVRDNTEKLENEKSTEHSWINMLKDIEKETTEVLLSIKNVVDSI